MFIGNLCELINRTDSFGIINFFEPRYFGKFKAVLRVLKGETLPRGKFLVRIISSTTREIFLNEE